MSPTRYVVVTGGVSSSLGKGLAAASLGRLLACRGLTTTAIKLDGYLNVDPGTLNPLEHGEVFVARDGTEADLDLGNYERVMGIETSRRSTATAGSVYQRVLQRERAGEYLGTTVQVVPHVVDEMIERITAAGEGSDICMVEVGGTVGDIENLPFIEAVRQLRRVVGRNNVAYVHLALVPEVGPGEEQKTKPVQHSVAELRGRGVLPDAVVCRSKKPIDEHLKRKISLQSDVPLEAVISAPDVTSIYDVPGKLADEGLDEIVADLFGLPPRRDDLYKAWRTTALRFHDTRRKVRIAIVGKYAGLDDAYLSVVQALRCAGAAQGIGVEVAFVDAETLDGCSANDAARILDEEGVTGVVVPGGFGRRGLEGKVAALKACRVNDIPTLGICLGMQAMAVEAARADGLVDATSGEVDPHSRHQVVTILDDQVGRIGTGGTMRLGAQTAVLVPDTLVAEIYGTLTVSERHRHRFEINPRLLDRVTGGGLVVAGTSPDGSLVEFLVDPACRMYIGCQSHPEFDARPDVPQPLFSRLVAEAVLFATETACSLTVASGRNGARP